MFIITSKHTPASKVIFSLLPLEAIEAAAAAAAAAANPSAANPFTLRQDRQTENIRRRRPREGEEEKINTP